MNDLLSIGLGGCGNKLLNAFMQLDSTKDGIFINSNINEMKSLSECNNDNRLAIRGNGTGRSRRKAKESLKNDRDKISDYLAEKITLYSQYQLLSSGDGGFGSGSIGIVAKIIRYGRPDALIRVVLTFPKSNSRRFSLENQLDCYNEILQLKKDGIINSIVIIDNNKMNNEEEFNKRCMGILLKSYNMIFNQIDENDLAITNFANGYSIPLELSAKGDSLENAIDRAITTSPFLMPNSFRCTHMLGIFQKEVYDKEEVLEIIRVKEFDKTEYGYDNLLLLGGCKMPSNHFSKLEDELELLDDDNEEDEDEFMVKSIFRSKRDNETVAVANSVANKRQLREMLGDDFFN